MNTQKPTDELIRLIASEICMSPAEDLIGGPGGLPVWTVYKSEAKRILTALSAAGYVIVPRVPTEATIRKVDVQAHVHWPNSRKMAAAMYDAMIAEAEKGE